MLTNIATFLLALLPVNAPPTSSDEAADLRPVAEFTPTIEADPVPAVFFTGAVPRTEQLAGDATLWDVAGIGDACWAVGDRGVVLRSSDAGQTWQSSFVAGDCTLRSVCFLTNQTGFAGGAVWHSQSRRSQGILLTTRDGGASWQPVSAESPSHPAATPLTGAIAVDQLPPIRTVRFFDLDHGVVVCAATPEHPAGIVARTGDGGQTWAVLTDESAAALWQGGEFLSIRNGLLFGHSNASSVVVGDRVLEVEKPGRHLRRWNDASLSRDGAAWLAGDNGQLLTSSDQGVSWKVAPLHKSIGDVLDYHSVDQRGSTVCVAGSPGSVVMLSTDAGSSWTLRQLPDPTPVHRIRFVSPKVVLAVGAFGKIHRSGDGGRTWNTIRSSGYHSALLSLVSNPENVPSSMLATIAGDEGYRSVVVQLSASLPVPGRDDRLAEPAMQRFCSALAGSEYQFDWLLTRNQPLQDLAADALQATWARQTDDRIDELLPLRIARLIRTWRPVVIAIDGSSDADQVQQAWLKHLPQALQLAGDTSGTSLLDKIGLAAWKPSRVVVRQHGPVRSTLSFDEDLLLARLGTTVAAVVNSQTPQLNFGLSVATAEPSRQAYRIFSTDGTTANPQHLFSGLNIAPGSAARRKVDPRRDAADLQSISRQAQIQKSALKGHLQRTSEPQGVVAQLRQVGHQLPPALQLQQLQFLAEQFASLEDLEGEIAVLKEIVGRFPNSAAATDAAETLFLFYSSEELRGLRRKDQQGSASADRVRQVAASIPGVPDGSSGVSLKPDVSLPHVNRLPNSHGRDLDLVAANWDRQAEHFLQFLTVQAPARANSTAVLLRRAANARRSGTLGAHRTVLAQAAAASDRTGLLATAEVEALQNVPLPTLPVLRVPATLQPPFLDGQITDECWSQAAELPMIDAIPTTDDNACVVLMTWDADHVYLAARIYLPEQRDAVQDRTAERRHDAEHHDRDRLSLMFDLDRDYTTGFHFTIDEAGQTSERCWRERKWNPKWFLAEMSDGNVWGFEAAIPHAAFGTQPTAGDLWSLHAERIAPGRVSQYLSNENQQAPPRDIAGFGLIRFVRASR